MADMHFEESCPCGNNMKISGYTREVLVQVQTWRGTHNKHANSYARAAVLAKEKRDNPPLIVSNGVFENLPEK